MNLPLTEREYLLEALRLARVRARVSKAQIARKVGMSRMTIGRMENGLQPLTPDTLRAYATLCGLDAPRLLLAWGILPEEVLARLQQNPHLVDLILQS